MRQVADAQRVRGFMRALGSAGTTDARLYFAGGASAVLVGWRPTTVDVDVKLVPDADDLLRVIPGLKESLQINVELASPDQFIPPLPGWEDRSVFIERIGRVAFLHYDFYAQTLAKLQRGHRQDVEDARAMLDRGLVKGAELSRLHAEIEPSLYRYPAVDPASFRRSVEAFIRQG